MLSIYIIYLLAKTRRYTEFIGLVLIFIEDPPTGTPIFLIYPLTRMQAINYLIILKALKTA